MNINDHERSISRVTKAIHAIKCGGMVIMTDDEDRENEGDLIFAAEDVSPNKINFMIKEARGLVCLAMSSDMIDRLKLPMMGDHTKSNTPLQTAFTVSIEAKHGVTTGISPHDRAHTIKVALDPQTNPEDLVVPGHVFPLKSRPGGVLERAGHTEGGVDLARLAGKAPAAVICEVINDDGSMARREDLEVFSKKHDIPILTIKDLVSYRLLRDSLVQLHRKERLRVSDRDCWGYWFESKVDNGVHFALVKGENLEEGLVDVRVQKEKPLLDLFPFQRSEGGETSSLFQYGLRLLETCEKSVFLYLEDTDKISRLREEKTTPPMDPRLYGIGAQILHYLGVRTMRLHTASRGRNLVGLDAFGLVIQEIQPLELKD